MPMFFIFGLKKNINKVVHKDRKICMKYEIDQIIDRKKPSHWMRLGENNQQNKQNVQEETIEVVHLYIDLTHDQMALYWHQT